jgi:5,5'-dehydrodivanillate O-demethylase oxygenase subunit
MLSVKDNEALSRVGRGTPMGELLRRYWMPVAASVQLADNPVRKVRILGEDLVLYRDRSGNLGLIGDKCAHRRMGLEFGIPEPQGLRCAYHGWLYNAEGHCLETPLEPADSTFKDRILMTAYPVQELGGLVFAYLGPQPTPLLPRWDLLVVDNAFRQIGAALLPCNWLQCQENSADPTHNEYLHGHFFKYILERNGAYDGNGGSSATSRAIASMRHHRKISFEPYELGIIKHRLVEGWSEDAPDWVIGHPMIFPNMVRLAAGVRNEIQFRVPVDDTHTWHVHYQCFIPPAGVEAPAQDVVPLYEVPLEDERGNYVVDCVGAQDMNAWVSQGDLTDRSQEHLGESDRGIILLRKMLKEQMDLVEDGGEPMNVFRDPKQNQYINLELGSHSAIAEGRGLFHKGYVAEDIDRYSPVIGQVIELYKRIDEARTAQAAR